MTTLREAAQQALEAIDRALPHAPHCSEFDVLADCADDLRAALSTCKPSLQVEPVAWMDIASDGTRLEVRMWSDGNHEEAPLYLAPPKRKPLTDEEMRQLWAQHGYKSSLCMRFARAVERAHGIGGGNE